MKNLLVVAFLMLLPTMASSQVCSGNCDQVKSNVYLAQATQVETQPAVVQNTVNTTGPVASTTTFSFGSLGSQILQWIMVAFGPVIGSIVVWILVRVLKQLGIQATDALRARLMDIATNGLNFGAQQVETDLQGKGQVEIKNAIVAKAVTYTQAHGAETIKALGLDPNSGAAVEAIKARIETALADPTAPTPAILAPAQPVAPKVAV